MGKLKVIVGEENEEQVKQITDFFKKDSAVEICGIASNGYDLLDMYNSVIPDAVVLDLILPGLDGFGVLEVIQRTNIGIKPVIIVLSRVIKDSYVTKAFQCGASYIMAKPFSLENLRSRLFDFNTAPVNDVKPVAPEIELKKFPAQKNKNFLDEKLSNLFIMVGIPAHVKGYQFLREAIKLTVEKPEFINAITKKLYPTIAERFNTTASKVERAIRHAIEVAWNRGKIEKINNLFGIKVYSSTEKPTNGEFIALIADKMLIEGA